ncbi:hypothetical protein TNCV_1021471 [Trichonephila clavipes]|uniref:Uncharacterized protein n=1 Tax=Trichonephila clavipes TaxID=2585209 RepID=A0A8X6SSB9_TRICX|nr:hypothetical protein TNCV_1021471 [Trichonephila clavipes]
MLEPKLLDIMIVQFRNEKVSNHVSIPNTIDCYFVAFIVFEEVMNNDTDKAHQTVSFSACNGVSTYTCGLASLQMRQFFFDVAIQPEVCFIAKPNSLMKIRNNGNLVLGPFDESIQALVSS